MQIHPAVPGGVSAVLACDWLAIVSDPIGYDQQEPARNEQGQ